MARTSERVKKISSSMKTVDEYTRALVHSQRLEALEQDNFMAKNRLEELTADDEAFKVDEELLPKAKKKSVKVVKGTDIDEYSDNIKRKRKHKSLSLNKRKKRPRFTLEEIFHLDNIQNSPLPNFKTMTLGPSKYPRRFFCTVCGFEFKYTCVRCGEKYCSKKCGNIHKETRCLKFELF